MGCEVFKLECKLETDHGDFIRICCAIVVSGVEISRQGFVPEQLHFKMNKDFKKRREVARLNAELQIKLPQSLVAANRTGIGVFSSISQAKVSKRLPLSLQTLPVSIVVV